MKLFKRSHDIPDTEIQYQKKKIAAYSTLGLMFPASIAVGLFLGYFLDDIFGTDPILTIILTLYGIGAGFYNFFKVINKYEKRK